jgi:hypothetical protein
LFEIRLMEFEAELGLYGAREAAAQRRLVAARSSSNRVRHEGLAARLWAFLTGRASADPWVAELLRIPLFATLPPDRFELLVRTADVAEVPAGIELIREGTVGREFFAISDGAVEVSEGGMPVAVERAGDFFGEIALLHGTLRTATVKTISPTRVFVMTRRAFRIVLEPSFE